jgi:hypothetical protein
MDLGSENVVSRSDVFLPTRRKGARNWVVRTDANDLEEELEARKVGRIYCREQMVEI